MKNRTSLLTLLAVCLMVVACDDTTKKTEGCGNGLVDLGEECDGSQMTSTSCAELGYYDQQGILTCKSDCTFDLSVCTGGRCGDGNIQSIHGEDCDGENLAGGTCASQGLGGGELACNSYCRFDISRCELSAQCGDDVAASPFEPCDGTDMDDQTCSTLSFHTGILACNAECTGFDTAGCTNCGNGEVDDGETCDGDNLNGNSCQSLGSGGGTLSCTGTCSYDLSQCEAPVTCGNGLLDLGEECDSTNLGGATCETLGYSTRSGALACTVGCAFDENACEAIGVNADLATLTVSSGTLTPMFSATTTSYTVTVPLAITSLTVAATAADAPYATVAVSPSQPMTLVEGVNPVTVTVMAEDGTEKSYSVTVTRQTTLDYSSPNIGTLKYVPGGTFQRDATVTNLSVVSAFRMSEYEITRAQWVAVTGWADPSNVTYSSGTNDPVQRVNWYDAIAFCNKLSLLEGLTPVYTVSGVDFTTLTYAQIPTWINATWDAATANWAANGYRLPTEMEWMWAAMGADTAAPGVTNTTGYLKAFAGSTGSNTIGDYSVFGYYASETGCTPTPRSNPVGSKLPSELGFYDLSGNVWEWNWDWGAASYPTGMLTDTRGPVSGTGRVGRGGNWSHDASYCTVAYRNDNNPSNRYNSIGFRVVRP